MASVSTGGAPCRTGDVIAFGRTRVAFTSPASQELQSTAVASGRPTPQVSGAQRRVLVALCRPLADGGTAVPPSNRELEDALAVSVDTVKSHLHALFDTFELEDVPQHHKRAELARLALQLGVVKKPELR